MDLKAGDVIKLKRERTVKGGVPGGVFTVEINGQEVTLYLCKLGTPGQISFDGKNVRIMKKTETHFFKLIFEIGNHCRCREENVS